MSTSPRPVPTAVCPTSPNATSAPSPAARATSSARGTPASHSASHATSAAAASADPPAMPPATGTSLWISSRTSGSSPTCSASATAARHARFVSSVGTASAWRPETLSETPEPGGTWCATTSSLSPTAWKIVTSGW
ncbi:Uncharacterised protein [Mycobacteroides abscessus]|nr:Uncharacterised protein [Mycobacteroides abscessus]